MSYPDYYKPIPDETNPNAAICTEYELRSIDRYDVRKCNAVDPWPDDVTFYYSGGDLEDWLGNVLGWLILSSRAVAIFDELAGSDIQWLPVTIVNRQTGETIDDYKVLNVLKCLPAMNRELSTYIAYPETPAYSFNVIRLVLDAQQVKGTHLFRLGEQDVIVLISEELCQRLEGIQATGFRYLPIYVR